MRCDDIRELMSAHVDGCLDSAGEKRLTEHLAACDACRQDLAALQRVIAELQALEPVAPPADLTAKIHARLGARPGRSKLFVFLNLPQTRVALAASLLVVVTLFGLRQMAATRSGLVAASAGESHEQRSVPTLVTPAVVVQQPPELASRAAAADPVVLQDAVFKRVAEPQVRKGSSAKGEMRQLVADGRGGQPDLAANGVSEAGVKRIEKAKEPNTPARTTDPGLAENLVLAGETKAALPPVLESRRAAASAPCPAAAGAPAACAMPGGAGLGAASRALLRVPAPEGYVFRTERMAEAAALVNRYASDRLRLSAQASDKQMQNAATVERLREQTDHLVLNVSIAPTQLDALLAELQHAGMVLVQQPNRANAAAMDRMEADANKSPTNILVRFTFLPPAP